MAARKKWTPEMDAIIGTASDKDISEQIGVSAVAIGMRRAKLGIPSYGSVKAGLMPVVRLDEETMKKIMELAPLLIEQIKEKGIPLTNLEPWQVVTIAINQLHQDLRRSNVRALYHAK